MRGNDNGSRNDAVPVAMKKFAGFVLSGYGQAVLCVAGLAWFAAFVPVTGIISSAALALVALEWGLQRAAIVLVLSTTALFALFVLAAGVGLPLAGYESVFLFALLQWLPIVMVAQLLQQTRSLSFTLNIMVITGLVIVALSSVLVPNSAELWDRFFSWMMQGSMQQLETGDADFGERYQAFLDVMTGVAMASLILVWTASLLLARWWQSLLDEPGGFRTEFTGLKLGKVAAVTGLALFLAMTYSKLPLMRELLLVMMSAFLFQGIATVHYLLRTLKSASGWLFFFYAGLALSPLVPQVPGFLSMLGALENLIELRDRMRPKIEHKEE